MGTIPYLSARSLGEQLPFTNLDFSIFIPRIFIEGPNFDTVLRLQSILRTLEKKQSIP